MFLDDDDQWSPDKVQLQLNELERNVDVGWVYTGMQAMDERSGHEQLLFQTDRHPIGNVWPEVLYRNFVGPTSAVAMRRRLFWDVGAFDVSLPAMQDYDLWIRLARRAPIAYDGGHHLIFRAVADPSPRVSQRVENYYSAAARIAAKYADEVAMAGPKVGRRMRSHFHILLASKHLNEGAVLNAVVDLALAIAKDPLSIFRIAAAGGRMLRQHRKFLALWQLRS